MMPADYTDHLKQTFKRLIVTVICGVIALLTLGGAVDSETGEIQSYFAGIAGLILLVTMLVFLVLAFISAIKAFKSGRRALREQKHDYSKDL